MCMWRSLVWRTARGGGAGRGEQRLRGALLGLGVARLNGRRPARAPPLEQLRPGTAVRRDHNRPFSEHACLDYFSLTVQSTQ